MKNTLNILLAVVLVGLCGFAHPANDKAANFKDAGYALDSKGDVVLKAKSVRITADDITTAELALDLTIPANAVVTEVYVNVITAEATGGTKTIDVGTPASGGDADGFLDGISVATTGLKKGTLLSSGQTLGALLRTDESGSSGFVPEPYVNTTSKAVVVTAGSNDFADLEADIIVVYKEITD